VIAGRRFHVRTSGRRTCGFREQDAEVRGYDGSALPQAGALYALALDLPANHFDRYFEKPHYILRQSR